jgi:hypothetical protein
LLKTKGGARNHSSHKNKSKHSNYTKNPILPQHNTPSPNTSKDTKCANGTSNRGFAAPENISKNDK